MKYRDLPDRLERRVRIRIYGYYSSRGCPGVAFRWMIDRSARLSAEWNGVDIEKEMAKRWVISWLNKSLGDCGIRAGGDILRASLRFFGKKTDKYSPASYLRKFRYQYVGLVGLNGIDRYFPVRTKYVSHQLSVVTLSR